MANYKKIKFRLKISLIKFDLLNKTNYYCDIITNINNKQHGNKERNY